MSKVEQKELQSRRWFFSWRCAHPCPSSFCLHLVNRIGLKFSSLSCLLFLSLSKQQVQFLSLRSLAKSYFTGVGGQEINLCIRKRRMLVTLGKRVGQSQLSLLNSWQQSDWNVGCRVTTRKRQLYSVELKLVSMVLLQPSIP